MPVVNISMIFKDLRSCSHFVINNMIVDLVVFKCYKPLGRQHLIHIASILIPLFDISAKSNRNGKIVLVR